MTWQSESEALSYVEGLFASSHLADDYAENSTRAFRQFPWNATIAKYCNSCHCMRRLAGKSYDIDIILRCKEIMADGPDATPDDHESLATEYDLQGRCIDAATEYSKAIAAEPTIERYLSRALSFETAGDYNRAIKSLERGECAYSESPEVQRYRQQLVRMHDSDKLT